MGIVMGYSTNSIKIPNIFSKQISLYLYLLIYFFGVYSTLYFLHIVLNITTWIRAKCKEEDNLTQITRKGCNIKQT